MGGLLNATMNDASMRIQSIIACGEQEFAGHPGQQTVERFYCCTWCIWGWFIFAVWHLRGVGICSCKFGKRKSCDMPTCLAAGQESEFLGLLWSCCTDSDDVSILGGGFNAVFECLDRRWSLMILNFRICVQYLLWSRGGALIQMDHILSSRPFHPVTTMWFFIPHWFGQSFCTLQIEKHGWQGYWTTSVAPKTGSPDAPSALHSRLLISDPAFSADSQKTVLTRPGSMVVRRAICCVLFHFNISNACGHGQLLSLQIWPCQKKMHRSHNAERCTIPHFVSRDAERCRSPRKKWFYLFCKQFQNQWKRYCRERSLHNHVGPDRRWRIQCDVWDVTNLEMNLGWQPKC